MLSSGVILALGGTLLLVVADQVPSLNVEPACRAAAKMGDSLSLDTTLRQCLADEKSAHDQLEKDWTQFAPPCASVASPPHRPEATPAMSKSLSVCRWGATRARSRGLRQAVAMATDNDAELRTASGPCPTSRTLQASTRHADLKTRTGAQHEGSRGQGTSVCHAADKPGLPAGSLSFRQSRVHGHHLSNRSG